LCLFFLSGSTNGFLDNLGEVSLWFQPENPLVFDINNFVPVHQKESEDCEILARSKDVIHDVKTNMMSRKISKHCDNTCNNQQLKVNDAGTKRKKLFVSPVWCNVTYIWGLPSQKGNSL